MEPSVLHSLVQQAAQAEARLSQIESRLSAGGGLSAGTVADLQDLKALLLEAKADNEQLQAERNQALTAAKAAQVEVSKLNYRILHLVRSLRAADGNATPQ